MVKIVDQKCVIRFEDHSVYALRQFGHQCICGNCYQNKSDVDIEKYFVCRT